MTTPDVPPLGTLYLAPNGDAYRLRDYRTDWDNLGDLGKPTYAVLLLTSRSTNAETLPEGALEVWRPRTQTVSYWARHGGISTAVLSDPTPPEANEGVYYEGRDETRAQDVTVMHNLDTDTWHEVSL